MKASRTSERPSSLLRLPPELRLRIYTYLAQAQTYQSRHHRTFLTANGDAVSVDAQRRNLSAVLPLLQSCRILHKEVEDFVYTPARFTIVMQNQAVETATEFEISAVSDKPANVLRDLSFLRPIRRLVLRAGLGRSDTTAGLDVQRECTVLAKLGTMLDMLGNEGMLEELQFDIFLWDVDRWPSDVARCVDKEGTGVAMLGPKTGRFRTRRLAAAREVVSKLQSLLI